MDLFQTLKWWDSLDELGKNLAAVRALILEDRFYLLVKVCKRLDLLHPWLFDRCREVERNPDGYLDLWSREHYKSTIITYAGTIQEVLKNPEIRVGIFSHTKPHAKAFLAQIKRELESNETLRACFPDILWSDPWREAPAWSLDSGIVVRRQGNPKESTVEAHGLVDGQPVGRHFDLMVYDDVVVPESVSTPDQVKKTTESWELSDNLGSVGGRKWHIGTRYSYADTYDAILKKGALQPRIYTATTNDLIDGPPVLFTPEEWARKKRDQGEATIACHCVGTSVLMANWTYKPIEQIATGDYVVGFKSGLGKGSSVELVQTKVLATNVRRANAFEYKTDAGNRVRCTPDHKWWTKRTGTDGHAPYAALGSLRKQDLKSLYRISNFHGWQLESNPRWQYLAGMLDGEGSVSNGSITITQSPSHNPEVCRRIRDTLEDLDIPYNTYERGDRPCTLFQIQGGRHVRHRILLNARPAKTRAIVESLFCRIGGKSKAVKERVIEAVDLGMQDVYNIQTETGNYVANGFGSKNCQMMQNPLAGQQRMFNVEDLQVWEVRPETLNVYILVDPARSNKKGSADTAMAVIGIDYAGNKYLLDGACHRMDLMERWTRLRDLYIKWQRAAGVQSIKCGYESYGAQADLDYIHERQRTKGPNFDIEELAWPRDGEASKVDRVQRLGPDLRGHRFYLPYPSDPENLTSRQRDAMQKGYGYRISRPIKGIDSDKQLYDVTEILKTQIHYFPFGGKVDLIDACARLYDIEPLAPQRMDESMLEPEIP